MAQSRVLRETGFADICRNSNKKAVRRSEQLKGMDSYRKGFRGSFCHIKGELDHIVEGVLALLGAGDLL